MVFTAVLAAFVGGEQVRLELGQLAGTAQGLGVDDVRGVALGVAVLTGLHVEHELRQGAVQLSDRSAHEGEARAGQLDAGVEVQAQRLANGHVVLNREIKAAGGAPGAQHHVAVFVAAHRHALVRQVGHGQEQVLQLGLNHLQAGR